MADSPALSQLTHEFSQQLTPLSSVLPPGLDPRRFIRTAVNAINRHPQVDKLLGADRQSLFNACQQAAADGLLLDGRESTLVVFHDKKQDKDVVSYIPMVQGMVKIAFASGIRRIVSEVVHQRDLFYYRPGVDNQPIHQPDWFSDRGIPVGVYAVATLGNGEHTVSVMTADHVMGIASGGRNADQYNPNASHYEEWWKKTAIKNVLKYVPKSRGMIQCEQADQALGAGEGESRDHRDSSLSSVPVKPPQLEQPADTETEGRVKCILMDLKNATLAEHLQAIHEAIMALPQEIVAGAGLMEALETKKQQLIKAG